MPAKKRSAKRRQPRPHPWRVAREKLVKLEAQRDALDVEIRAAYEDYREKFRSAEGW